MPKEMRDESADSFVPGRYPSQQLHYYGERPGGYRGGARYSSHSGYYQWPARVPYYSRPDYDSPLYASSHRRDLYGPYDTGGAAYSRDDYRRTDQERELRSPDGRRNSSEERDRGSRKRRHHKGSKHRHRHSRHHRNHRHKKSKRSSAESDRNADDISDYSAELPSLTLGAEISRKRRHISSPVTAVSAESPEPGIIEDDDSIDSSEQAVADVAVGLEVSNSESSIPVAYADDTSLRHSPRLVQSASPQNCRQSVSEGESDSSIDSPHSRRSQPLSDSDSDGSSTSDDDAPKGPKRSPNKTSKVRSSYATALAAKLRQNRQALVERAVRRPENSRTVSAVEDKHSVIDKNTETIASNLSKASNTIRNSCNTTGLLEKSNNKCSLNKTESVNRGSSQEASNPLSSNSSKIVTENRPASTISHSINEPLNSAAVSSMNAGVPRLVV